MVYIKKNNEEKLAKMHEADNILVKGIFTCLEPKGGDITFPYRKYKEDKTVNYHFEDGKEYEIPICVAKHLNNCGWEVNAHLLDKNGDTYVGIGKKEKRFVFQSNELI
jgi:hypothetical protein